MKGWVLDTREKYCYEWVKNNLIKFVKIDCWKHKAPDDFENHEPCKELKKIG